jgi:hypothetical protein
LAQLYSVLLEMLPEYAQKQKRAIEGRGPQIKW